jgi:SNF2 family DNA or RNA helicase
MNNNIVLEMTMKMQHVYSCAEEKFLCCKKIISEHGAENVIIFCKFVDSRLECEKRFPGVTVLSIQSDAYSLNLQSKNVTIEFDKTWDYGVVDQYRHRIFRTGQTKECYHYYLQANTKLDRLIAANNEKKQDQLQYFKSITKDEIKDIL